MIDVKLLKNSVLFRLKNKCAWGNSGKVEVTDAIAEKMAGPGPLGESEVDKSQRIGDVKRRLKAGKKLIICPEYDRVKKFQTDTKDRLLTQYCNPSFLDDGLYAVRTSILPEVVEEVKRAQVQMQELIQQFLDVYSVAVEGARVLGDQFNARNYPETEQLRNAFSIEYRVVQLDIPEGLPPEIRQEEEAKLRKSFEAAEQELTRALREGFASILTHVTDRLEPGPDGKRKGFKDTLFVDFVEFVQSFQNKNVLGDAVLSGMVERAKTIWQNVANGSGQDLSKAAQRVREIEPVRERALAELAKVKAELDKTIADMPSRAFDIED